MLRRILYRNQIKAIRWRGRPSLGPVSARQQLGKPCHRSFTGADLQKRADNVTHHVMKKGVGTNVDIDESTRGRNLNGLNKAHRMLGLTG